MKNKRIIAGLFAMVMTIVSTLSVDVSQASAKIKYSDKITLYVGEKKALSYMVDFKKISPKKVKFKSFNKKIATISKKGVVKGKKKGKTKISGKYKGKTLYVKVTVKKKPKQNTNTAANVTPSVNTPSTPAAVPTPSTNNNTITNVVTGEQLAANISVSMLPLKSGKVLFCMTNNNSQTVPSYYVNYQIKNTAGVVIGTGTAGGKVIHPGETQYDYTYVGTSEVATVAVNMSAYTVSAYTLYDDYVDRTANVSITHQKTVDDDISLTFYNGAPELTNVYCQVLFYDAAGQIVDIRETSAYLNAGETMFDTVTAPYELDNDFNYVSTYSSYKVFYYAYS